MAKQSYSRDTQGGYEIVSSYLHSVITYSLAFFLLFCAIPFFIIIPIFIKIYDRGPVFYKGVRLGRNKKLFTMYKFRTLAPNAQEIIGAQLLTSQITSTIALLSPLGKFLRETRLDELPQLFNIILGDMDFLGPRPERPEIYEKLCRQISGYDKRFKVKPGLIGYSQLFTPHSSPKRIRTLLDNRFITKKQKFMWDIYMIFMTIFIVFMKVCKHGVRCLWRNVILEIIMKKKDKRKFDRVKIKEALVYITVAEGHTTTIEDGELVDINEDALLVYNHSRLPDCVLAITMEIRGDHHKKKTAECSGLVHKCFHLKEGREAYAHIINYSPASPLNEYMIHQYFLKKSVI